MASLVLTGDTSGQVTLAAPAVAGTTTVTLQATTGTMALQEDVIGIGQTWTNVTASRVLGTTYTNSTGRPILVNVIWGLSTTGGHGADFTVSGVVVSRIRNNASASGTFPLVAGVVIPSGATYLVSVSGSGSISLWSELR